MTVAALNASESGLRDYSGIKLCLKTVLKQEEYKIKETKTENQVCRKNANRGKTHYNKQQFETIPKATTMKNMD